MSQPMPELDPRRPFLVSEALAAGVSPRVLRCRAYTPVFRNVKVPAGVRLNRWIRAEGALLVHPEGAFISHRTAARLQGLPVPDHSEIDVSVVRAEDRRFRVGIRNHVAHHDLDVLLVMGVLMSSPKRLFCELARTLSLVDLVALGDALVRRFAITPAELIAYCRAWEGYARRHAIRCAELVRPGVRSVRETRLRLLLVLAGLPELVTDLTICDVNGVVLRRLDLGSRERRLGIEYDGRQHLLDVRQWEEDVDRLGEFDDEGWRILRVTNRGVTTHARQTLVRAHRLMLELGVPGTPRTLDPAWEEHFLDRE